ncbi:radical SAM protein [Lachnospiraceae bacterium OttesenSCG-928-E19]|nr:radical SAM protein [Lachnospiraceae bacterium OttesenSCG-928-E19]
MSIEKDRLSSVIEQMNEKIKFLRNMKKMMGANPNDPLLRGTLQEMFGNTSIDEMFEAVDAFTAKADHDYSDENHPPFLSALDFSRQDLMVSPVNMVRMYVGELCNLKCNYCFADATHLSNVGKKLFSLDPKSIMANRETKNNPAYGAQKYSILPVYKRLAEIKKISDVAKEETGVPLRTVMINGAGEPTLDPNLPLIIDCLKGMDINTVLITNGLTLTEDDLKKYDDLNVSLVLKLNSVNERLNDEVVGVPGSYKKFMNIIDKSMKYGYIRDRRHSINCVITDDTAFGVHDVLKFTRSIGSLPWMDEVIHMGRGKSHKIYPEDRELIHHDIWKVEKEFGYDYKLPVTEKDLEKSIHLVPYPFILHDECFQITNHGRLRCVTSIEDSDSHASNKYPYKRDKLKSCYMCKLLKIHGKMDRSL